MKTLTKLKIQRFLNRRSNGIVEQIEKILLKLQSLIAKLDAEQDAANAAMNEEISKIRQAAFAEVDRLTYEIAEAKARALEAEKSTASEFQSIIDEAAAEANRAKKVQRNITALTD